MSIAPSTYRTSELALRADRGDGPPRRAHVSVLLHQIDESTTGACVTHTVAVSHAGALRHALLP